MYQADQHREVNRPRQAEGSASFDSVSELSSNSAVSLLRAERARRAAIALSPVYPQEGDQDASAEDAFRVVNDDDEAAASPQENESSNEDEFLS